MALKPLTDYNFKMKVIKDLGYKKPTENYYKKVRMAVFECTNCKTHFEAVVTKKAQNQLLCKQCNGVTNIKPNRDHKLYRVWADTKVKLSCTDTRAVAYLSKSISICDDWKYNFDSFFKWAINNGWKEGLSIDRIDNNGNYEPSNCRWVDMSVQLANQRVLKKSNTTGYRGISKEVTSRYTAMVSFYKNRYGLGTFDTALEAAKAYDSFITTMNWPHTKNNVLKENEIVFPTNKSTVKYLSSKGIHKGNFMSKEL